MKHPSKTPSSKPISVFRLAVIAVLGLGTLLAGTGLAGYLLGKSDNSKSNKPDAGLSTDLGSDSGNNNTRKCVQRLVQFKMPEKSCPTVSMDDDTILDEAERIVAERVERDLEQLCRDFCITDEIDEDEIEELLIDGYVFSDFAKSDRGWVMRFAKERGQSEAEKIILRSAQACPGDSFNGQTVVSEPVGDLNIDEKIRQGKIGEIALERFSLINIGKKAKRYGLSKDPILAQLMAAGELMQIAKSIDAGSPLEGKRALACRMASAQMDLEDRLRKMDDQIQKNRIETAFADELKFFDDFTTSYFDNLKAGDICWDQAFAE